MKKIKSIRLDFCYGEKDLPVHVIDENFFPFEEYGVLNWSWWEDGNGGCDCNRSIFIHQQYDKFPIMGCGHTIELLDYEAIYE